MQNFMLLDLTYFAQWSLVSGFQFSKVNLSENYKHMYLEIRNRVVGFTVLKGPSASL